MSERVLRLLFAGLFGLGITAELSAQRVADLFWFEYGAGYVRHLADSYTLYDGERVPGRSIEVDAEGLALGAGIYWPLYEFSRSSAIGLQFNAMVWLGSPPYDPAFPADISHLDQSGGAVQVALPVMAMLKTGSDATIKPNSLFGAGLGLGLRPVVNPGLGTTILSPIAAIELNTVIGESLVKLRASGSLLEDHPLPEVDIRSFEVALYFVPGG